MSQLLVAGVDCSTQKTKIVVVDAATGRTIREASAEHPLTTEVDPAAWERAFVTAASGGLLDGVTAMSVGAQQHGLILLDSTGATLRDALLWNDTRSGQAAHDLTDELGGRAAWVQAIGTVPVASLTVTKLRWVAEFEPEIASHGHQAVLPHDWLTWRLLGAAASPTTDRSDASGTGYWDPATGSYRPDLLRLAFGRDLEVPAVLGAGDLAGVTASRGLSGVPAGISLGAGAGDNAAAALGVGAAPGDVLISVGTSGTVFATHVTPTRDVAGFVAGFADATDQFLPLVATLNAARVLSAGAAMLNVDPDEFDRLALSARSGSDGLVLIPYLEGERTPDRPDARGRLCGMSGTNCTPANLARATVEGMLCGLADGLDALAAQGVPVRRVLLLGGGSRSRAVQTIAPSIFGVPVWLLAPTEYVALGAARQAVWASTGELPSWPSPATAEHTAPPTPQVRANYAQYRDGMGP